jgi:predicted TIM-barrel fold metal-dependent hydrolase
MIDVNVSVDRWPFRRLPGDEPSQLVDALQRRGVTQAWVGSFDGVFHKDLASVNSRLADVCRKAPAGLLVPFGAVNPRWPEWREDLRRCHEVLGMPGIRLHPNYHGYRLDDPLCAELLLAAAERGLLVQLAVRLEDVRIQHPLMQVPDVDTEPLPALIAACPNLKLVLLNGLSIVSAERLVTLAASGRVFLDIATLEGMAGIGHWLTRVPITCLLFGSHFPFFIWESAALKLRESALTASQLAAITHDNARRLLPQVVPGVDS